MKSGHIASSYNKKELPKTVVVSAGYFCSHTSVFACCFFLLGQTTCHEGENIPPYILFTIPT